MAFCFAVLICLPSKIFFQTAIPVIKCSTCVTVATLIDKLENMTKK